MKSNTNLNLLRTLQVLLTECHVSRTAQQLNLTQSAVSRQLAQLRDMYGDPLLVREGNVLRATPKALSLKSRLDELLNQFDSLLGEQSFDPKEWQTEFVLSSSDYLAQYILPDFASHVTREAPNLSLTFRLWQPDFLGHFHSTGIDLASTMLPQKPEYLSSIQFGEDGSVCLMKETHPLAAKLSLSREDLVKFGHIKVTGGGDKDSGVDRALEEKGLKRHIAFRIPFFSAAVNTLMQSHNLMVVPEHIAINLSVDNGLTHRPLNFDTPSQLYWLMWHPKYDHDPAHQWVRERALKFMRQSQFSEGMIIENTMMNNGDFIS
ncbi:LysR family transcriptional regulator [Vibrio sonorensis]|uniref:LysR family transcriptional regulator n=1 Tax=Vibrio sonorensis TaxID=1004316 RepID=UPI0008D9CBA8|nr:LysR family transcriptional regulator [Vibrio sonorensis]